MKTVTTPRRSRWPWLLIATSSVCLVSFPAWSHGKKGCAARSNVKWVMPDANTKVDLSPKFGGKRFSAPNGYHHFEAVFIPPYQVKIYLYDGFGQPMQGAFFRGTVAVRGEKGRPPSTLVLAPDGTLEAEISRKALPFVLETRLAYGGPSGGPKPFDQVFKIAFDKPAAKTGAAPLKATTGP